MLFEMTNTTITGTGVRIEASRMVIGRCGTAASNSSRMPKSRNALAATQSTLPVLAI